MPRKSKTNLKTSGGKKTLRPAPLVQDFWRTKTIEQLAKEQGVKPIENPDDLLGDFWPEDESIDDFLLWLRRLRRDDKGVG
ncbi:MAG TPA: hypothetical protein VGX70_15945 [Gemmataceae bacterium]|nr:hypothetical protein [Gemmataceae bacterium]